LCADDSKFEFQTRYALDACKVVSVDVSLRNDISFTTEQDDDDKSAASTDSPPSPKYTMLEKWIMDQQRKKLLTEQGWVQKQQKTKQRIATCFDKLKVCLEILLSCLVLCHLIVISNSCTLLLLWAGFCSHTLFPSSYICGTGNC
jgi:hypothetical protein